MLKNFLTDQLPLAVAIGSQPNFLNGAQCLPNGFELSLRAVHAKTQKARRYCRAFLI